MRICYALGVEEEALLSEDAQGQGDDVPGRQRLEQEPQVNVQQRVPGRDVCV